MKTQLRNILTRTKDMLTPRESTAQIITHSRDRVSESRSIFSQTRIISNTWAIIKKWIFQFLWMILMTACMIILLNIVIAIFVWAQKTAQSVQWKLWVYFYIKTLSNKEDEINWKVIEFKQKLEQAWLKVEHHTKAEAFKTLTQKLPTVAKSFEKYGINNPLPQTLYVTFDNQNQFNVLKSIVPQYNDIILEYSEDKQQEAFKRQQDTIVNAINFSNIITRTSSILVAMIIIIMITMLLYVIRVKFMSFIKDIEVQKLLWASYLQIKLPFYLSTLLILIFSTLIAYWVTLLFTDSVDYYMLSLFSTSIYSILGISVWSIWLLIVWEFVIIWFLLRVSSVAMLHQLIKEV